MGAIETYRIAGGAPAGMRILAGELGWRTKRTSMRATTIRGKRTTTPRGTDMLEFPFNRSGLLKMANRDVTLRARDRILPFSSRVGSWGDCPGAHFEARRSKSMVD